MPHDSTTATQIPDAGAETADARAGPARPVVIAVVHQKGGTGKTTAACNLAVALARLPEGGPVTVVDLDPQGTASACLAPVSPGRATSYDLLAGHCGLAAAMRPTRAANTFIVPAGPRLMLAELDPELRALSHDRLRAFPGAAPGEAAYVLLDCPPGFGVVATLAALTADLILLPTPPLPYASAALDASVRFLRHLRPDAAERLHVLVTLDDATDPVRAEGARRLRETWRTRVLETSLPLDPAAEHAAAAGRPVVLHAPQAPLTLACRSVAQALAELPVPPAAPAVQARAPAAEADTGAPVGSSGASGRPAPGLAGAAAASAPASPAASSPTSTAPGSNAAAGAWRTRLLLLVAGLVALVLALAPDAVFSPAPAEALADRGQAVWAYLSERLAAWTGSGHGL